MAEKETPKIRLDGALAFKNKPRNKCCEDGAWVDKVVVSVINRGSPVNQQGQSGLPGWSGGHIDLVIPGCDSGLIGFFGSGTYRASGGGVGDFIEGAFLGIPGVMNTSWEDWTTGDARRPDSVWPKGTLGTKAVYPPRHRLAGRPRPTVRVKSWICDIEVCPSTAKKMCEQAMKIKNDPKYKFAMTGRNCSTRACKVLRAGGIFNGGIPGIDNPQDLQKNIKNKTCYYGYTVGTIEPWRGLPYKLPRHKVQTVIDPDQRHPDPIK